MLGVFQFAFGWNFKEKIRGWKYNIAHGIISIIVGFCITVYPVSGVIASAAIFGISLLAYGVFLNLASQRMRKYITV